MIFRPLLVEDKADSVANSFLSRFILIFYLTVGRRAVESYKVIYISYRDFLTPEPEAPRFLTLSASRRSSH